MEMMRFPFIFADSPPAIATKNGVAGTISCGHLKASSNTRSLDHDLCTVTSLFFRLLFLSYY